MANLNGAQLETLWVKSGGDAKLAPVMAAIALAESGGNPSSLNNHPKSGDFSVGLWQINYYGNLSGPRTARYGAWQQQLNPYSNVKAAVDLARGGRGLDNWSTFKSGAYVPYLKQVPGGNTVNPSSGMPSGQRTLYPWDTSFYTSPFYGGGGILDTKPAVQEVKTIIKDTKSVGDFLGMLSSADFWLRVGQVIGGAILLGMGLFLLMKQIGLAAPTTPLGALAAAA